MENKIILKYFIMSFFEQVNKKEKIYFVTLTYSNQKIFTLDEKIELIKKFIKSLKVKEDFDYFWVKEEGENNNIHIHLITNWSFSYNKITEKWNKNLNEKITTPSTHIEIIKDIEKVVNYLFKEDLKYIGISSVIRRYKSLFISKFLYKDIEIIKNLDYKSFKKILTEQKIIKEKGTKELQMKLEEPMFEKFYKKDKKIVTEWLRSLNLNKKLKEKKKIFIEKLEKYLKNNNIKVFIKEFLINLKLQKWSLSLLWNALLFLFLILTRTGKVERIIDRYKLIEKIEVLLFNLIDFKIDEKNGYKLLNLLENKTNLKELAFEMLGWIEIILNDIINISIITVEDLELINDDRKTLVQYKIKILKSFKEIEIDDNLKIIKQKNPMVVEPKDWKIKNIINYQHKYLDIIESKLNFKKSNYIYGGYLNNGLRFFHNISKLNSFNEFKFLNQESLDIINYLQKQKLKINENLLNFIIDNNNLIEKSILKMLKSKDEYEKELEIIKYDIKILQKNENNIKLKELMQKKYEIISLLSKYYNYLEIIKLAKEYSKYEFFYYTYEVDFRGRIYVVSDYLNHQGSSLAKSLIYFYEESVMNIYWFKI